MDDRPHANHLSTPAQAGSESGYIIDVSEMVRTRPVNKRENR
jgi:hypothetical protein